MNEPKFTPGPWVNNQGRIESDLEHGWVNDGWCIAECNGPQAEINAHLIAAAPDLYKALAHLEPYLDAIVCYASTIEEHPPNGFILETKAALAKARGEG